MYYFNKINEVSKRNTFLFMSKNHIIIDMIIELYLNELQWIDVQKVI